MAETKTMSTEEVLKFISDETGYNLHYLRTALVESFYTRNLLITVCEKLEDLTGVLVLQDGDLNYLKKDATILQIAQMFAGELNNV
ncbi:MAG: hypothetical protein R3Y43_01040 [Alphaproteobacteria bacterium]